MFGMIRKLAARLAGPTDPRNGGSVVYVSPMQAGVRVDEKVALTYSAWLCAVKTIAETIGVLPWYVLEARAGGKGHDRRPDHPAAIVLRRPNPEMTAMTFKEVMTQWALTWGNAIAEIERNGRGEPLALWPISPDRVEIKRRENGGEIYYRVHGDAGQPTVDLPRRDVFHLKGLGFDGLQGYSVARLALNAIGLGLAIEKSGSAFFGNGARPAGVIKSPEALSPEARDRLRDGWQQIHRGPANAHKVAVLDGGMEFSAITMPFNEAQALEQAKFNVVQIARFFRLPPHKLGDLDRAALKNVEQQAIDFVTDAILPWCKRAEEEADIKLFDEGEEGFETKLNIAGILRGDIESRYKSYAIARQWGWLSANDVRELEDLNPIEDGSGDIYLTPGNMMPSTKAMELGEDDTTETDNAAPDEDEDVSVVVTDDEDDAEGEEEEADATAFRVWVIQNGARPAMVDAWERVVRLEVKRGRTALKQGKAMEDWATDFYARYGPQFRDTLEPICQTLSQSIAAVLPKDEHRWPEVREIVERYIADYTQDHRERLCAPNAKPAELFDLWDVNAPAHHWERLMEAVLVPLLGESSKRLTSNQEAQPCLTTAPLQTTST